MSRSNSSHSKNQVSTNTENVPTTNVHENGNNSNHNNNSHLQVASTNSFPFGFGMLDRWFSERFGFPSPSSLSSRFWADPFFESEGLNSNFEDRFEKMLNIFDRRFREGFGGSSGFFGQEGNDLAKRTQRLFEEFSGENISNHNNDNREEKAVHDDNDGHDNFLNHPKELEDLYNRYHRSQVPEGDDGHHHQQPVVTGRSFVSSTICRNGKSVTVSKHSELTPEGKIKTRVDERFRDHENEGRNQSKSWRRDLDLNRIGQQQQNMIQEEEKKRSSRAATI